MGVYPHLFSWNLPGNDMKKEEIERISRCKTTGLQRDDNGNVNGNSNGNAEGKGEGGVYTPPWRWKECVEN